MNFRTYESPVRPDEQARMDYKSAFDGGVCLERVRTNVRTNGESLTMFLTSRIKICVLNKE